MATIVGRGTFCVVDKTPKKLYFCWHRRVGYLLTKALAGLSSFGIYLFLIGSTIFMFLFCCRWKAIRITAEHSLLEASLQTTSSPRWPGQRREIDCGRNNTYKHHEEKIDRGEAAAVEGGEQAPCSFNNPFGFFEMAGGLAVESFGEKSITS